MKENIMQDKETITSMITTTFTGTIEVEVLQVIMIECILMIMTITITQEIDQGTDVLFCMYRCTLEIMLFFLIN